MAVETDRSWREAADAKRRDSLLRRTGRLVRWLGELAFSSLTRRIAILNLAGLVAMVSAILYLNQFREGLIDASVQSLLIQGEIIAGAISASATIDFDEIQIDPERLLELEAGESLSPTQDQLGMLDFPINPERVAPILRRLISPTKTRARIYDRDGVLLLDSKHIYSRGQILQFELPAPEAAQETGMTDYWKHLLAWFRARDLPIYRELGPSEGRDYSEVSAALSGDTGTVVRVNEKGEMIVSVAVPVQRFRTVLGALLLSTRGGDIDTIVAAERMAILRVFLVAAAVTLVLSILLAGTIAGPVRKLATAAERVRYGTKARAQIPDFTERRDEIGHLSHALRDMTKALYSRIESIERFAADVAHELKNPLTSLRSAAETLPLARTDEDRERLLAIVRHDVERLNRLITDISDASRLDAELARDEDEPVDIDRLLGALVEMAGQLRQDGEPEVTLDIAPAPPRSGYFVNGHDVRLGQVFSNLIDNAKSFSPPDGTVAIAARRTRHEIVVTVEDEGPGIPEENLQRIFERFYTDRGENAAFGEHSGLGLSISRQIVEAHGGTITAENRETGGTRFTITLPAP